VDDNNWADLGALADPDEFERVRSRLPDPVRAEFDDLWRLLEATRHDAEAAGGLAEDLLLLVTDALPGWIGTRKLLAPGSTLSHRQPSPEAVLARLFGDEPPQPQQSPPGEAAADAMFARIRDRLLGAPSRQLQQTTDPGVLRLPRPDGGQRLPDFQFEPDGRPFPVVLEVNGVLCADDDPWAAADWWLGPSLWFPHPPAEMIGRVPDAQLIDAAHAAMDAEW
jgi:hypothetical protein